VTITTLLHITEWLLFIPFAYSIVYIFIYAMASLLPKKKETQQMEKQHRYLVIFPSYAEDKVIVESAKQFLEQTYPKELYTVAVVSDHMKDETNRALQQLPIDTLIADYHPSSKAKALQLCINSLPQKYDYVVILDADNLVPCNFLEQLNSHCIEGTIALQAHRQAKNLNSPVALLDAASEEINNTIFRLAHNQLGIASALIGSGMCFDYQWFAEHVMQLSTAGEDKELEEALLTEGHTITYLPNLPVWDEKVQSGQNFGNQRRRWIAAQLFALKSMAKKMPNAIAHGNINLIDKFVQQMLVPRSLCLCACPFFALTVSLWHWPFGIKWCILTILLITTLLLALPSRLYNKEMGKAVLSIPGLVLRMVGNLFHLRGAAKNFIHTQHGE